MNLEWLLDIGFLQIFINLAAHFTAIEGFIVFGYALFGAFKALMAIVSLMKPSIRSDPSRRRRAWVNLFVGVALGSLWFFVDISQQSFWDSAPEHAHTYTSQITGEKDPIKQTLLAVFGLLIVVGWYYAGKSINMIGELSDNPDQKSKQIKDMFWMFFGANCLIGLSKVAAVGLRSVGFDTGNF